MAHIANLLAQIEEQENRVNEFVAGLVARIEAINLQIQGSHDQNEITRLEARRLRFDTKRIWYESMRCVLEDLRDHLHCMQLSVDILQTEAEMVDLFNSLHEDVVHGLHQATQAQTNVENILNNIHQSISALGGPFNNGVGVFNITEAEVDAAVDALLGPNNNNNNN